MILADTREKKNRHILKYFTDNNIEFVEKKLDIADYRNPENPYILIERKQNLAELAGNISSDNAIRIKKEFCRMAPGCTMVILVEENLESLEDVVNWRSKYNPMQGAVLYKYMVSWQYKHKIEYMFCDKKDTGRIVAQLLGVAT